MTSPERRPAGGGATTTKIHGGSARNAATSATQSSATMRPALDQSTQQRCQASPTVGKHVRPVRRMSSRAAQSSGKRSASVRNGLRKQPAIRPPLAQRRSTRCTTRRVAALLQARDVSPTMRDGRAIFGRRSCGVRAASARNDASHGAAACGGAWRSIPDFWFFRSAISRLDTIMAIRMIRSGKHWL
ncbi:hypothetical protein F511_45183 [Dorcoceras hygrometricum]|uniref:Uncharacterized protein n=1 Tax=Dorcoceras hygrometricum TaxID=472368 RepID=A0A2Z6ZWN7_9LAMI|nr:hypothetical protein F511_45183 [Dorcoceras hygrometricum]